MFRDAYPLIKRFARRALYVPKRLITSNRHERAVLLRAAWDLWRVKRWLAISGYSATWRKTQNRTHPIGVAVSKLTAERTGRIVTAAARRTIGLETSCLPRSIVLCWYLRSAGIACDLVSGMGRKDGKWIGHAWVEVEGKPVLEAADIRLQYPSFRNQLSKLSNPES